MTNGGRAGWCEGLGWLGLISGEIQIGIDFRISIAFGFWQDLEKIYKENFIMQKDGVIEGGLVFL
jgi:hypothetical protein